MRVNICVNGTFRYPDYVRFFEEAGVLNAFYFAHRRSRSPAELGLPIQRLQNLWPKHYLSAAAFHAAPSRMAPSITTALCDAWQGAVIRRWLPCDSMEAVIGAVADRVIAHARREGVRVLGHPVTSHATTMRRLVDQARAQLGLSPDRATTADKERRQAEIEACDTILVDSTAVARSFIENGVAADRVKVVRPGIDSARFHPRSADEVDRDTFLVVCVGIVTPRKAQHLLLRAWQMLKLPRAKLLFVGALGRDAAAVLRGHDDRFTHIPHIGHAALRALLVRASCFVLASAEDGFAQAPLEAMACGVPVILSRNVGAADLIQHGANGFVVPPFEAEALAVEIERLYRDRALGDQLGRAAADTVRQAGSWADYVPQVIALHRHLIAGVPVQDRVAA